MRSSLLTAVLGGAMLVWIGSPAWSQETLLEATAKACQSELEDYCADVTPGEGRLLACLYAHGDKLSGQCEYGLYDAAVQLERAVAALTYVVNECADDLEAHCQDVQAGEGRLLQCLDSKGEEVSQRCRTAISDVGLQ